MSALLSALDRIERLDLMLRMSSFYHLPSTGSGQPPTLLM